MPLTILKNPAKTPLLEKAFWERNDLLYQVLDAAIALCSPRAQNVAGGQTLSHRTDQCSCYLRLDSAEKVCRGTGYETYLGPRGPSLVLGGRSEKAPSERSV